MEHNTSTFLLPKQKESLTPKKTISIEYGDWLNSYQWHYYCTFTTRYQLSKPAARRSMARLQEMLYQQYMDKPTIFWVAEPFDTRNGCHLHALVHVKGKVPQTITHIKNAWQIVSKGKRAKEYNNTTIKEYDPKLGGHYYVSKYLFRNNSDYDIQ